ncbi:Transcription initiation factor IIA, gamma subunit, helical domain protein [Dictyocaulus viviparus]|uniref:Transcription initiation factor IIA, gamma subunit, helical domain protein n=1 Tax=Dictyocaulus viviparus TaxID=29172 RepID=A0A0D8YD68_DICVI|nr:Transcription initiation factor IIA, gamma subunit, helical domain protein [Dictyocaulus viviparus]
MDGEETTEHVEQVFEFNDLPEPGHEEYSSDDEEQQSTSNFSDVEACGVIDDSSFALQAHEQDCFSVAVIAERWLASGGEDDVAYLWDNQVSDSVPVLKIDHDDSVIHVAFNNGQTLLSTGDMSGKIIITQLLDLKTRAKINDCNDLEWMCWHTTSDILFAGDKDGIVWMWLIGPRGVAQSKVYNGNGSSCTVGGLLPDGKRLLAGYADGAVRLWFLKDGNSAMVNVNSAISAVHHHVSQPIGVVGAENGSAYLLNTSHADKLTITMELIVLSKVEDSQKLNETAVETCVECVQFAPFNSWLAVGRNDGTLCIYETASGTLRSNYAAPSSQAIMRAVWSMEENIPILCVGSVDGFVRIFDARDGSLCKMTYYQMYRNTTLGEALQKTLDDLVHEQMIPPQLAVKVLAIYDKAINKALAQKAKNKMYFKAEKLRAYRHCDNVWTFLMERVDFRDSIRVARVKFVACDGSAKLTSS